MRQKATGTFSRRTFLTGCTYALASPSIQTVSAWVSHEEKLKRLAFASYSLHNFFPSSRKPGVTLPDKRMTLFEMIPMVVDTWNINQFEIHTPHFESTSAAYLKELKGLLQKYRSRIVHVAEVGTNLSRSDPIRRAEDVATYKHWVDVAKDLGATTLRINSGRAEGPEYQFEWTVDSYKKIAAYALSKGIHPVIENHWGVSESIDNIIRIIEGVGPELTTSPDFGNFPNRQVDYAALERLFRYAKYVMSCKVFDFVEGERQPFDFARCMRIMNGSPFRGVVSLEYQGELDPYPAIEKGFALTLKHL